MITRHLSSLFGSEREVRSDNWTSRRLVLAADGMGFSLHDTVIFAGTETVIWYQHHLEAVYCIDGEGELECIADGEICRIEPGLMYALNAHDRHVLRAFTELRLICVFNPPLQGREIHDANGAYPASAAVQDL